MKSGQIWSVEFDCYVSQTFMPRKEKTIKLDITNCVIKINFLGFYYLWLNGKCLRQLTFDDYLKYRKYVKSIDDKWGHVYV